MQLGQNRDTDCTSRTIEKSIPGNKYLNSLLSLLPSSRPSVRENSGSNQQKNTEVSYNPCVLEQGFNITGDKSASKSVLGT